MKILFCSASTNLTTGYAKISAQILNTLAQFHDVWHLAFQSDNADNINRKIDPSITVLPDKDFGASRLLGHVDRIEPDVVMVYNDVIVCHNYCRLLEDRKCRFIVYLDLTYEYQNWVVEISDGCDLLLCFHETWMKHVIDMGVPASKARYVDHPPPQISAAPLDPRVFGFSSEDFVVLNLNRNSYRKFNDITLDGFIRFFKSRGCPPNIKLFLGCKFQFTGTYDIPKLITHFSKLHGLTDKEHDTLINKSIVRFKTDSVSDDVVHQLYQSCTVGLNTTGGEGYGLCNIEHQLYGKPQIVTGINNFYEFFSPLSTYFLQPQTRICIPPELDVVGGVIDIPCAQDVARGLEFYYDHPNIRNQHGQEGMEFLKNRNNNFKDLMDII